MARLSRLAVPGQLHLIAHRGWGDAPVFTDADDRESYLSALREAAREARVAIHAYGLFDHEVRLLVTPSAPTGLGDLMQRVGRRFVPAFNRRHGRSGTPWDGRFRSALVDADEHFITCLCYVEVLPRRADPAEAPERAWSSLGHHRGARRDPLITEHSGYWRFGNTPFERERAHAHLVGDEPASDELAAILHAALAGWALGSPAFVDAVGRTAARRVAKLAPGRPRRAGRSVTD